MAGDETENYDKLCDYEQAAKIYDGKKDKVGCVQLHWDNCLILLLPSICVEFKLLWHRKNKCF
jgi:hypothetical protein